MRSYHPAHNKLERLLDALFQEMRHMGHPLRHARLEVIVEDGSRVEVSGSHAPDRFQQELPLPPTVRGSYG